MRDREALRRVTDGGFAELGERYKDPGLTPTQEKGFRGQLVKVTHQLSELTGNLRTQVDWSGPVQLPSPGTSWVQVASGDGAEDS